MTLDVDEYLVSLTAQLRRYYGERLTSLAVYGSLARGEWRRNSSDIDLLVVLFEAKPSHFKRSEEFLEAEGDLERHSFSDRLSPIIRTRREVERFFPLMLDMTVDIRFLFDRDAFLLRALTRLKRRLTDLKAKRVHRGSRWYWDLKPDIEWGEVFSI